MATIPNDYRQQPSSVVTPQPMIARQEGPNQCYESFKRSSGQYFFGLSTLKHQYFQLLSDQLPIMVIMLSKDCKASRRVTHKQRSREMTATQESRRDELELKKLELENKRIELENELLKQRAEELRLKNTTKP